MGDDEAIRVDHHAVALPGNLHRFRDFLDVIDDDIQGDHVLMRFTGLGGAGNAPGNGDDDGARLRVHVG